MGPTKEKPRAGIVRRSSSSLEKYSSKKVTPCSLTSTLRQAVPIACSLILSTTRFEVVERRPRSEPPGRPVPTKRLSSALMPQA